MRKSAGIETPRSQVCISFGAEQDKLLTKKYKAYVAKCSGRILAKAAWARLVLLTAKGV